MKPYLMQIQMSLRLTFRNRAALVFGYGFPLAFFFLFGSMFGSQGNAAGEVVSRVLSIGVLGTGLFGAGLQAVMNREQNILRRFKVAPITPMPLMVSAMIGGLVQFMPMSLLILVLANRMYKMPWPEHWGSLLLFIAFGVLAFCAVGNIIAAVVNSMQEAQMVTNLIYMPMLLLGGATIPLTVMPNWVQILAQFLPSSYFMLGIQGLMRGRETFIDNLSAVAALLLTAILGTLLAVKLFRWEKEEQMRPAGKLWLAAVLGPFLVLGGWQAYAKDTIKRAELNQRDNARGRSWLIHDARIFTGDGKVIEQGSVLIKDGKIAEIYTGTAPEAKSLGADAVEAVGKTLLPGLIDVHAHLGATGLLEREESQSPDANFDRELAAYLYSGVTTVRSLGDALDPVLQHRTSIASGSRLGAELLAVGPMFTTQGGHGTEFTAYVPKELRQQITDQIVRLPKSAEEARAQVAELKTKGVDAIKVILDAGGGTTVYNRLDLGILRALVDAAHQQGLTIVSHTGSAQDVADAVDAGVDGVEHGSMRDVIPVAVLQRMKAKGVVYDPTLAVLEAMRAFVDSNDAPLQHSLVRQIIPPAKLTATSQAMSSPDLKGMRDSYAGYPFSLAMGQQNLLAAYKAGVTLVTGTDSGNPLLIHGPAIHREMKLWVDAGVPAAVTLQAATSNAARLLRAEKRIGSIAKAQEANLVLVDGNPLEDITTTEHISSVFFKGERIDRAALFQQK